MARLFTILAALGSPDIVVFEDVQFQTYTLQTQLWSSLRAAAWLAFDTQTVFECVPVTTLKLFATGSGAATKEMMSAALKRMHPDLWSAKLDDNAIDAIWILIWAETNLARMPLLKS